MAQIQQAGSPAAPAPPERRRPTRANATPRRRLLADSAARWLVTAGGLAIIASILGILLFIVVEIAPLFRGADVEPLSEARVAGAVEAVVSDEYRSHVATLSRDGWLRVIALTDESVVLERRIAEAPLTRVQAAPGQQLLTAATADGRVLALPVEWQVTFVGRERRITPRIPEPVVFPVDPAARPVARYAARIDADGAGAAVAVLDDGTLAYVRREVETNLFSGETTESFEREDVRSPVRPSLLVLGQEGRNLYAGTDRGRLVWWRIEGGVPQEPQVVTSSPVAVTAMTLLIGDRSLIVGRADGSLETWFPVRDLEGNPRLTRIRAFPAMPAAVSLLSPSLRKKGFLAQDESGRLGAYYSTSARVLWQGDSPVRDATALFYAPKGDGAFVAGAGRIASLAIDNPHPEVSWRALFGRVWYEGYEQPEYVWQSTGGTDDFESKLSLTPLMVGTLKGALYSLLLAIPLGVFGAMFTSQFMHFGYKRYIKPTVEIMAALPSVVLGFLAGLWLAPRIEKIMPALILMFVVVPALVLVAGYLWRALPGRIRHRFVMGSEIFVYVVAVLLAIWVSIRLGPAFEGVVFGGDFQAWLLEATGLRYDQRNAIVVGLAMGFAVIPIIFSIAEDAFSNVPRNLVAGSLALGATRWQTVTRVVLPTASPGIFSAIIIGFGRAVGETMIVLMATGNTPVLDWNPFNGFRTLSANIAVEIPEAPHGETLYRTLFLAALILFVLTFVINTFAELIRQRLRKRYAQL